MGRGILIAVLFCLVPLFVIPAPVCAQWIENGKAVCTSIDNQGDPLVIPDDAGGSIIVWMDNRSTTLIEVCAQRLDSNGTVLWEIDGTAICNTEDLQDFPKIAEDGSGGAVITWQDTRNSNHDLYAQRIGRRGDMRPYGMDPTAQETRLRAGYTFINSSPATSSRREKWYCCVSSGPGRQLLQLW